MSKPNLPAAVQQLVDSVTEGRRRYITRTINWCAYNSHGIRIAVIFPHPGGEWAVAGRMENPWAAHHDQRLRSFTLEAAKEDVAFRNPMIPLRWESVEVEQAGHEFAPVEKSEVA